MENDELTMNVITMINKWLPETAEVQKIISSYKAAAMDHSRLLQIENSWALLEFFLLL